jgi:hypothetical protein
MVNNNNNNYHHYCSVLYMQTHIYYNPHLTQIQTRCVCPNNQISILIPTQSLVANQLRTPPMIPH